MSILKILKYGHPLLREKAMELKGVGTREKELIAAMGETMYAAPGIGLAATQVGVMERLFVLDVSSSRRRPGPDEEDEEEEDDDSPPKRELQVFINPVLVEQSDEDEPYNEGCLSIPGIEGEVYRPSRIKVVGRDQNFEPIEVVTDGLLARVIQHEADHLDGVLFVDKLALLKRSLIAGQLNRLKREVNEELPQLAGKQYPILR